MNVSVNFSIGAVHKGSFYDFQENVVTDAPAIYLLKKDLLVNCQSLGSILLNASLSSSLGMGAKDLSLGMRLTV